MHPPGYDVASTQSPGTELPTYDLLAPLPSSSDSGPSGIVSSPRHTSVPPPYIDDKPRPSSLVPPAVRAEPQRPDACIEANPSTQEHVNTVPDQQRSSWRSLSTILVESHQHGVGRRQSTHLSPLCRTEHTYSILNTRQSAWVTLRVNSMARSASQVPVFVEGVNVCGAVDFDLPSNNAVRSATLSLTGRILSGSTDSDVQTFLDHRQVMEWSMDEPARRASRRFFGGGSSGMPAGKFTCPFVFKLPEEVYLSSKPHGPSHPYKLPPSFADRFVRDMVRYELSVLIKQAKFISHTEVGTVIYFTPLIRPKPASLLRQISYQEHSPLLGPDLDPDGWHTLPAVNAAGRIFNVRDVEVNCTLSLAKPLCYSRGSILPFHIVLHSEDEQALDLLASPQALDVRLHRAVGLPSQTSLREGSEEAFKFRHTNMFVQSAVLWMSTHGSDHSTRHLEGEIPLPNDLKPSACVRDFVIAYSVVLLPFSATAFAPHNRDRFLEVPVKIANVFPRGPRPTSSAPQAPR
ncbi:hypothetical protein BV22DRAFT_421338 [Leucogyrophana mollusca]|uniref:Uncharacterized protein n=1 Tax=Leucogyrophana mollusca TaxID=85980 RepID=A0ACB8BIF6_9AGAM|nr:hypothetical protein BV22DRAFT_421338 [Leucogyrophana mollusca]